MSLISTRELSIGYLVKSGNKVLQRGINVSINNGEIISLVGQNGVGKTTFIKTISGLLPSIDGEVYFRDKRIISLTTRKLASAISLVLTEKPGSLNLSVIELVALGRHPYSGSLGVLRDKDKAVIERVISETGINYMANKKLFELSDGQLQIVMIARALAQETDVIILDEPTAHLDLHNKIEVMRLLKKIASQGKAVLISTHDIQICAQLSDRLWLFNFNSPLIQGIPEDLILRGAIHETLFLDKDTFDLEHGTVNLSQGGIPVVVEGTGNTVFWTAQALRRKGFEVTDKSDLKVKCNNPAEWNVISGTKTRSCSSLEQVLNILEQSSNLQ